MESDSDGIGEDTNFQKTTTYLVICQSSLTEADGYENFRNSLRFLARGMMYPCHRGTRYTYRQIAGLWLG